MLGRLLARSVAGYARAHGLRFRVLALEGGNPLGPELAFEGCGGSRLALGRALLAAQLGPRPPALVFDLLGLARVQALLPRQLVGPSAIFLLGIEVWRPLSPLHQRALEGASLRVAISQHTRERARPFLPDDSPVEVLHLALEERAPQGAVDLELLARLGSGYLLTVGRMGASERYKGHDAMLAAMPALLERQPRARWVVVGGGDDRPRLERRAGELGVAEQVSFTGFANEATLAEVYRRAAAFVMLSRGEGFGLVYLEAMRAGLPCVAATASAAEEIVRPGETGFIVDPDSPQAVAGALAALLAEPAFASRLGAAGRQLYHQAFSRERFERGLASLLDRLVES